MAYVWSAVYVDAMVLRDRDLQGDGTYDERLYVQQDANYNPASLSDISGAVVERFAFDPYGVATLLDPNWAVDAGGSDYAWIHLHRGGRHDPLTGLVHFRFRDYSPMLGRWTQQDSAGFVDGANRYEALMSNPPLHSDPIGLSVLEWLRQFFGGAAGADENEDENEDENGPTRAGELGAVARDGAVEGVLQKGGMPGTAAAAGTALTVAGGGGRALAETGRLAPAILRRNIEHDLLSQGKDPTRDPLWQAADHLARGGSAASMSASQWAAWRDHLRAGGQRMPEIQPGK